MSVKNNPVRDLVGKVVPRSVARPVAKAVEQARNGARAVEDTVKGWVPKAGPNRQQAPLPTTAKTTTGLTGYPRGQEHKGAEQVKRDQQDLGTIQDWFKGHAQRTGTKATPGLVKVGDHETLHGVEPATRADHDFAGKINLIKGAAWTGQLAGEALTGKKDVGLASDMLSHYMSGSGKPYEMPAGKMDEIQSEMFTRWFNAEDKYKTGSGLLDHKQEVLSALKAADTGGPGEKVVQTGSMVIAPNATSSSFGNFTAQQNLKGEFYTAPNGDRMFKGQVNITGQDRYDFNPWAATRYTSYPRMASLAASFPQEYRDKGWVRTDGDRLQLSDRAFARLAEVGLARDFVAYGGSYNKPVTINLTTGRVESYDNSPQ